MEGAVAPVEKPDRKYRVRMAETSLGERERLNVLDCLDRNWISQGKYVARAEELLCEITGRKYAVCTSSGTAALWLALVASSPSLNKTVAVPSLAFAAVHNVPQSLGMGLHFVDSYDDDWQVSFGGLPPDCETMIAAPCFGGLGQMDLIHEKSRREDIFLIEDAAESFLGSLNGRPAGSFGDISCVSFYANKIVAAGEGGACLTNYPELEYKIRLLANHGIAHDYIPEVIGLNFRMTDLQAAILVPQLERRHDLLDKRYLVWGWYDSMIPAQFRPEFVQEELPAPWVYATTLGPTIGEKLRQAGIETRPFFYPGHMNPLYGMRQYKETSSRMWQAERLWRDGVILPCHPGMTMKDVQFIGEVVNDGVH